MTITEGDNINFYQGTKANLVNNLSSMNDSDLAVATDEMQWYMKQNNALAALDRSPVRTSGIADGAVTDAKLAQTGGVLASVAKLHSDMLRNAVAVYQARIIATDSNLTPFIANIGDSVTVSTVSGDAFDSNDQIRFYRADGTYINYYSVSPTYGSSRTFTYKIQDNAAYVGVTKVDQTDTLYSIRNNSNIFATEIDSKYSQLSASDTRLENSVVALSGSTPRKNVANRFDKTTITEGYYLSTITGNPTANDSFFTSDFIYIGDLQSVTASYTHILCWYDASRQFAGHPESMNTNGADMTFDIPDGVEYLRFSNYLTNLDRSQIGQDVSRDSYAPHDEYTLPGLVVSPSQVTESDGIIVDAAGGGDYTSFTRAIYETVDSGIDVQVMPGTYDIEAEYVELFGQEAVDSMADSDTAVFNGFQFGVRIRNRRVTFHPGAHLVCDWTGRTVDGTHRFSALGVDYEAELVGLDLDCTGTFYAIHDDYGRSTPYTNRYSECRVVGHSLFNANCIGGGCKKYSRHIISNCYFDNNLTGSATVRYHNTNAEGAEPEIYVSDTYFNNWFTPRWYGTQTSKMRVYVNNCYAAAIYKVAESSSFNVDNVELYKWNNTETNPVQP